MKFLPCGYRNRNEITVTNKVPGKKTQYKVPPHRGKPCFYRLLFSSAMKKIRKMLHNTPFPTRHG
jgi:hypothetical protein